MANKSLFSSSSSNVAQATNTTNANGGTAYALSDKAALAKYAMVGTLADGFYTAAEAQLDEIIRLTNKVPAKFIAQLAIHSRESGFMKDMPAFLCAVLASKDVNLLKAVFPKVIDNGKMLRNFIQIIRSGKTGRKSFGTSIKKMVQRWFESRSDASLFRDSVGNDPSLADVIKLVHPSPANKTREALYAYIIGKEVVKTEKQMKKDKHGHPMTVLFSNLPEIVQQFENYKEKTLAGKDGGEVPNVEWRMLTALNLGTNEWTKIAKNASFTQARMNLNTFERHGVFKDTAMVNVIAEKLRDKNAIQKAKVFPYQIMTAFLNTETINTRIKNALQDALEIATENVPAFDTKGIHVLVDTSGSMGSSVTGNRGSATSVVSNVQVASLIAATVLRKNEETNVVMFDTTVHHVAINPRDSVMTNAQKFARNGGGTDCGCAVQHLNRTNAKGDLIIMVSDNESNPQFSRSRGTGLQAEWNKYKSRNPKAKLVLIDISPSSSSSQAHEDKSVLNISGFSDNVFTIVQLFVNGQLTNGFVEIIEAINIEVDPVVNLVKTGAAKAVKKIKRDSNGRFV